MQSEKNIWSDENLVKTLEEGGVVVMPTDTIYGLVGRADNKSVVNRIYTIRKRSPEKPCIILIGHASQMEKFAVRLSKDQQEKIKESWPVDGVLSQKVEPVSIIFDCLEESLAYLHRGTKTLAFRLPVAEELRNLLMKTGPLIAPSANPEGLPPATNIEEAKNYFSELVDLYVDGGKVMNSASRVVRLFNDGSVDIIRP